MDSEKITLLILLLIGVAIFCGYKALIGFISEKVYKNSQQIQGLVELNKIYSFKVGFPTGRSYTRILPSKKAFDTYRLEDRMQEI